MEAPRKCCPARLFLRKCCQRRRPAPGRTTPVDGGVGNRLWTAGHGSARLAQDGPGQPQHDWHEGQQHEAAARRGRTAAPAVRRAGRRPARPAPGERPSLHGRPRDDRAAAAPDSSASTMARASGTSAAVAGPGQLGGRPDRSRATTAGGTPTGGRRRPRRSPRRRPSTAPSAGRWRRIPSAARPRRRPPAGPVAENRRDDDRTRARTRAPSARPRREREWLCGRR